MSEENVKPEEKDTSQTTHTEATPAAEQPAAAENRDKAARAEGEKVSPATESPAVGAAQPASAASEDEAAKAKAREEARAARAAARAAKAAESGGGGEEKPKEPSPNQPKLDRLVEIVREALGEGVIQEAYINERDRHLPVIVVDKARWTETARLLKEHSELKLDYLRNVTGVDYETHMEVDYFLTNLSDKQGYCVKVRMDREEAEMPSAATVWPTANWPEREIYDLLGVTFTGHPDLRRIMMPDDWVGHPLRKDYEPIDPEV